MKFGEYAAGVVGGGDREEGSRKEANFHDEAWKHPSRLDPIGERSKQAVKKDSASFGMEVKMENSIYIYKMKNKGRK